MDILIDMVESDNAWYAFSNKLLRGGGDEGQFQPLEEISMTKIHRQRGQ